MENQEFMVVEESESKELIIDNYSKTNLSTTATWAQILAIIGFIGIGFMVLLTLIILFFSSYKYYENSTNVITSLVYIVVAAIMFYPLKKLYEYSKFTKSAIRNNNQKELILAFESQRKYFKYIGFLSLIYITIFILGVIGIAIYGIMKYREIHMPY